MSAWCHWKSWMRIVAKVVLMKDWLFHLYFCIYYIYISPFPITLTVGVILWYQNHFFFCGFAVIPNWKLKNLSNESYYHRKIIKMMWDFTIFKKILWSSFHFISINYALNFKTFNSLNLITLIFIIFRLSLRM